eukprot:7749938-Pyramimonas_sp.AAC.1
MRKWLAKVNTESEESEEPHAGAHVKGACEGGTSASSRTGSVEGGGRGALQCIDGDFFPTSALQHSLPEVSGAPPMGDFPNSVREWRRLWHVN